MSWFYLDEPNSRELVADWKKWPRMLGLWFYFNERHPQSWLTGDTSAVRRPCELHRLLAMPP
jgi:hypothetical protein